MPVPVEDDGLKAGMGTGTVSGSRGKCSVPGAGKNQRDFIPWDLAGEFFDFCRAGVCLVEEPG